MESKTPQKSQIRKIIRIIGFAFIVFMILLSSFGFINLMTTSDSFKEYCVKEFSGIVQKGYCTYILNGTSQSFPMDTNWIRGNTNFIGGLK